MNKQLFFKVEFHSSIEEKRDIRLNITEKLLLGLFNNNFELNYNENIPKVYNLKESTIIKNLKELVKLKVIEKNNKGSYKIVEDLRENFDSNKGFYVDTVLFTNPKLTPTSIIIYSFFAKYKDNGFALCNNGFKQYIKCSNRVRYENIELLISENLLKKEKTGMKKQFKYYALPHNLKPIETPSEEVEEIEEEVKEQETIEEIPTADIELLNQRLNKASEVCKQLFVENEKLKAEIDSLNKKINSLYDRQMKFVNIFQPVIERIDEIDSDVNSIYHLTDNIRQKQETELNMNILRGLI